MQRHKLGWLITTTVLICTILGPFLGLFFYGVFVQKDPALVFAADIAGMPFLFYAFLIAGPIAFILSPGAVLVCIYLAKSKIIMTHPALWLLSAAIIGTTGGTIAALLLCLLGGGSNINLVKAGSGTGIVCGIVTGIIWWMFSEKRSSTV